MFNSKSIEHPLQIVRKKLIITDFLTHITNIKKKLQINIFSKASSFDWLVGGLLMGGGTTHGGCAICRPVFKYGIRVESRFGFGTWLDSGFVSWSRVWY